jgi:hypothetical protein
MARPFYSDGQQPIGNRNGSPRNPPLASGISAAKRAAIS